MEANPHRRSAEEWSAIVKEYEARDCTAKEFCRRHGIQSSTLKYHLDKRAPKRSFSAVTEVSQHSTSEVVLEFPNGIHLTIRG